MRKKKLIFHHLIIQLWIFTTRSASCPNLDSSNFQYYLERAAAELMVKSCKCSSCVRHSPTLLVLSVFTRKSVAILSLCKSVQLNKYLCLCTCLQHLHRVSLCGQMSHLNTIVLSYKPQSEDFTSILQTAAK